MKIMLDSGAYSAWRKGETLDLDTYIQFLHEHKHLLDDYVSLDVIGDGEASWQNFKRMKEAGLDPMPVYHAASPIKYLEKYLANSEYVGIGALTALSTAVRIKNLDMIWADYLTDDDGLPIAKFHGMGFTTTELIMRYPWWSVDSSTWLTTSRMGIILTPRCVDGRFDYKKAPVRIEISSRSPHKKEDFGHFETLSIIERERVQSYFESYGFEIGESTWEGDEETKVKEGLCNNFYLRDKLNSMYFIAVMRNLDPWPFSFTIPRSYDLFAPPPKPVSMIKPNGTDTMQLYSAGVGVRNNEINCLYNTYGIEWLRMVSYYHKSEYRNVFKEKEAENAIRTARIEGRTDSP